MSETPVAGFTDLLAIFANAAIELDEAMRRRGAVVAKRKALEDAVSAIEVHVLSAIEDGERYHALRRMLFEEWPVVEQIRTFDPVSVDRAVDKYRR